MGTIRYDNRFAPVYLVSFEGTPSRDDFIGYLDYLSAILARGERYAVIVDASSASGLPSELRKLQTAWIRINQRAIRNLCIGTSFVIVRSFIRRILSLMLMGQPLPAPTFTTDTLPSAVMWTVERLQISEVPLPLGLMHHTAVSRSA